MLKALRRSRWVQSAIGRVAVAYLALVRSTTRCIEEPAGFPPQLAAKLPGIIAMWHGQHLMVHFAWTHTHPLAALVSRSGDGDLSASIIRRIGLYPVRGAGGEGAKIRKRGGPAALREMLRLLAEGTTVALTADVPKKSRVAGPGIVALAQMSGMAIYPLAVVSRRRLDFRSWDRASIGLPFSRGAMVLGEPIRVAADADAAACETARLAVEQGLNAAHARAYALVGSRDPGAEPRT